MYEQSARWNACYRELEPARRRALLSELCASEPDDGANAYRLRLFEARHGAPGQEVDRFLFMCVSFIQVYESARVFRRGAAKEVEKAFRAALYDEAGALGEAGERALYWELRNAAARYFKTCESAGYGRRLFGLMGAADASRQDRMCRDAWRMSRGLAARTGLGARMRIWNDAVLHAYLAAAPDGQARFEALERRESER